MYRPYCSAWGGLVGAPAAFADGGAPHAHDEAPHAHGGAASAAPAPKASPVQKVPAAMAGIWQKIDEETAKLDKVTKSGALDQVHLHAYAIRDLVADLPARSQGLTPKQLARINSNVKLVAILAARLDATGDAKDKAGTQANFEKLKKVLAGLRADFAQSAK